MRRQNSTDLSSGHSSLNPTISVTNSTNNSLKINAEREEREAHSKWRVKIGMPARIGNFLKMLFND